MIWIIIIIAIVVMTMIVVLFPNMSSIKTTGEYAFASCTVTYEDKSRLEDFKNDGSFRKLSVLVYYPDTTDIVKNSCPLIVFSHGGISISTSNESLYKELASHGYVVASISHTYHALSTKIEGRRISINSDYMKELNTDDSNKSSDDSYACYQKWMALRTGDINFVIDTLIQRSSVENTSFYPLIDANRIGLSGHSLGGAAVLGVARQRNEIKAVIALESPYMCDITGVDGNSFKWTTAPYTCAIMNIYSDSGYILLESDNKYVQNKNHLYNGGKIEYCYIEGSNHFSLTDLVRTSPILCTILGGRYSKSGYETLQLVNEKSVAFFNRYLK